MKTHKFIMIFCLGLVLTIAGNLYSQNINDSKKAADAVATLKQKILLSDDQEAKILNLLKELQPELSANPQSRDSLIESTNKKISSLLDGKQNIKFDVLKKEFWKSLL